MPLEQLLHFLQISLVQSLQRHRFEVTTVLKRAVFVQYIRHAARHTGGKISSRCSDNNHPTAGHILARVVAYAFNNRPNSAVADAEALARHATNISLAAGGTIKSHV